MKPAMDKAAVIREVEALPERLCRLAAAVPRPPNPRLRESDTSLKRSIARLRSGAIRPVDPAVDAAALADAIGRELEYRERLRELIRELDDLREMLSTDIEARTAGLLKQILTTFHEARHLPAAADPNSDLSEGVRRLGRARRAEFGRRRRK
jgi:hypothetical protein